MFSGSLIFRQCCRIRPNIYSKINTMSTTNKPKVFVTRKVPQKGVNLLKETCLVSQWDRREPISQEVLKENVRGIDGLFCLLTDRIDEELLSCAGPQLKVIGTMSVGYDHIDLQACKRHGVSVGYTPDVLTNATAELTISLLLATSRRLVEAVNTVRNGEWGTWDPLWMCGTSLAGSTVGIIGYGRIGQAVATRVKAFDVNKILYYCRQPKSQASNHIQAEFANLDEIYMNCDFIIACISLNSETQNMFNIDAFRKMKNSAIFINTSRGSLVNQEDLYEALSTNMIRAAGLDVTVPEPISPSHNLLTLRNCIILPHIGSATEATRDGMSELTARNILAALEDKPIPAQLNI